jgi:hypothetical protein
MEEGILPEWLRSSSQSLFQINWKTKLRVGAASTTKVDLKTRDSIMPKRYMQPVESTLPVMPKTANASASNL